MLEEVTLFMTDEFQKEDRLDQEVREITFNKHMEKFRKENIEYQTMFRMIKTKLAKEKGLIPLSNRLSREKINYLSRQVLNVLEKNDQVEFMDDPNEIRLIILRTIEDEMKLYEALDKKAIDKIQSQKKAIEEGSRRWKSSTGSTTTMSSPSSASSTTDPALATRP